MKTAAALVVGSELLTGKIRDENLAPLARRLRELGVVLRRAVTVLDDEATIAEEVRALAGAHTWVVTSGGVGPTHDDVTLAGVARAFGASLVASEPLEATLRILYGERLLPGHLRMARLPEGARLVGGEGVPFPAIVVRNVWVLPGVPALFRVHLELLGKELEKELEGAKPFVSFAAVTRLDEGTLAPLLDAVVSAFPEVDVGSYPRWTESGYSTKLTFDGQDPARVRAAREAFVASLPEGEGARLED